MTKVLITGGFGFVGARVARHFATKGLEVRAGSREPRDELPNAERVTPWVTDWADPDSLARACRGVDLVIHCAGLDSKSCAEDPAAAVRVNCQQSELLGEIALQQGVKRLIFVSTAHVYCSPLVGYLDESSPTTNSHPYAVSNLLGEHRLRKLAVAGNINVLCVRLSNAFGVPVLDSITSQQLVVNDLCFQAMRTGSMTLTSATNQWRNFIGMNSMEAVLYALTRAKSVPETLNVGQSDLTLFRLATLIADRCHSLFNFRPQIVKKFESVEDPSPRLRFSSNALANLGVKMAELSTEIDELLVHCATTFQCSE